ncbi:MAG: hypothetical protein AAGJ31_04880, partial [Verrucomicrobiota bacterium]
MISSDLCDRLRSSDLFRAEGRWIVESLLRSSLTVDSLFRQEGKHHDLELPEDIPLWEISAAELSQLAGYQFHRGILAFGVRPSLQKASVPQGTDQTPWIICPNLTDASNLGALVRSAAAFSSGPVGLPATAGADPYSPKAIRASAGT